MRIGIPSNPNFSLILLTIYLLVTLGTLEFLLWYIENVGGLVLFWDIYLNFNEPGIFWFPPISQILENHLLSSEVVIFLFHFLYNSIIALHTFTLLSCSLEEINKILTPLASKNISSIFGFVHRVVIRNKHIWQVQSFFDGAISTK